MNRKAAGHRHRVTRRRLRNCMIVECVGKDGTAPIQTPQASAKLRPETRQIIRPHCVDRDEHDQFWRRRIRRLGTRARCPNGEQSQRQNKFTEATIHWIQDEWVVATYTAAARRREDRTP